MVFACACFVGAFVSHPFAQAPKEPTTVILKGNPMGGVKFDHKVHAHDRAAGKCETCHHASKPEKPLASKQQKCQDCHTKAATAPMKTAARGAFHDPMAKAGTCVTCHNEQNAKGKKAPVKCQDCHKKENV
jgi:class III cytochrome C family protein